MKTVQMRSDSLYISLMRTPLLFKILHFVQSLNPANLTHPSHKPRPLLGIGNTFNASLNRTTSLIHNLRSLALVVWIDIINKIKNMSIRHCRCILNEDIQSYLLLAFSYTLYGDGIYDIFFTHVKKNIKLLPKIFRNT